LSFVISASTVGVWKLRKRSFDIIFVYEPSPITVGIPAAILSKIKKTPLVFWVLDLWPHTLHAVGIVQSKIILNFIGKLVKFIYSQCDLILAQSRSFITHIRQYAPASVPVEYFPNWAESVFENSPSEPAQEINKKPGDFIIMFAGNLGDAQDFPAILKAAELLKAYKNIRWIILGDGRMKKWIDQEIKKRGLQYQFQLLGVYPLDRMPSFFMHADALLVSLKDDPIFAMTIPGKLQSYLASGIPIVGMINGEGHALIIDNEVGKCVASGSSSELARAIQEIIATPISERSEMGTRGKALYKNEFSRNILIEKIEEMLNSLRKIYIKNS
jgi:glycosyltransferase involved in cell wall biosynthesis